MTNVQCQRHERFCEEGFQLLVVGSQTKRPDLKEPENCFVDKNTNDMCHVRNTFADILAKIQITPYGTYSALLKVWKSLFKRLCSELAQGVGCHLGFSPRLVEPNQLAWKAKELTKRDRAEIR